MDTKFVTEVLTFDEVKAEFYRTRKKLRWSAVILVCT